jgi:large subunit ribosomal protein L18
MKSNNYTKRLARKRKVKAKIIGFTDRPRLAVYRSNKHFEAQVIDDRKGITLLAASDIAIKTKAKKIDKAIEVGKLIADKAKSKNIKTVVFDRAGYRYHGRVKAFADSARKNGLEF